MVGTFKAQIAEWATNVEGAFETIFKEASQDLVEEAQLAGYSVASQKKAVAAGIGTIGRGKKKKAVQGPLPAVGNGGNLPVDTGFLRASLRASVSAMPQIEKDKRGEDGKTYPFDPGQIEAVIAGADLGDTIYLGYTAAYASAVHFGLNGQQPRLFVTLAAQKWPQMVDARAAAVKSRLGL